MVDFEERTGVMTKRVYVRDVGGEFVRCSSSNVLHVRRSISYTLFESRVCAACGMYDRLAEVGCFFPDNGEGEGLRTEARRGVAGLSRSC